MYVLRAYPTIIQSRCMEILAGIIFGGLARNEAIMILAVFLAPFNLAPFNLAVKWLKYLLFITLIRTYVTSPVDEGYV